MDTKRDRQVVHVFDGGTRRDPAGRQKGAGHQPPLVRLHQDVSFWPGKRGVVLIGLSTLPGSDAEPRY